MERDQPPPLTIRLAAKWAVSLQLICKCIPYKAGKPFPRHHPRNHVRYDRLQVSGWALRGQAQ
jgi:hypothetical protein